ncbi:MAG: tyrosine-type recombinase/integrase [Solirubrobacteraceae bacterium]
MATGVCQRHGLKCNRKGRCDCPWQASVYSKRDGKKIRRAFPTRAAAKAWREDKLGAVKRGELRPPTATTVRQAAEAFLAGARDGSIPTASGARYKPATLRGYKVGLDRRVLPALCDRRLSEIQRRDVQDLADRLTAEGLSASTVQNTLDPLRVIFRRAMRREEVAVDPTKGLELRRPDGKRERIAAPEEAAELLAALADEDRALWATAVYAGLRRGELRALRWSDVDLPARVIHVQRGWDAIEGEQKGKSEAADRRVPILDLLAPDLAAHKLRTGRDGDALVFGRTATTPFSPESVRRHALTAWGWREVPNREKGKRPKMVWVKDRDDALEPITFHNGRHTCASLMIAANVNAKALSVIMGHATISMTYDVYGHLMPGAVDEAAAQVNAYIARTGGEPPKLRAVG